jgi:RND family efflux transporter MFP subunit
MNMAQESVSSPSVSNPRKGRVVVVLGCVLLAAAGAAYFGVVDRARSMQEVETWTNEQAIPSVHVISPKKGSDEQELSLPGTVRANYTGSLYARATGYITAWHHDIGSHVKKGDVLAEISAPDLDQQLAQARAQLLQLNAASLQAQANADLSVATNQRTARLVVQGWSSAERGDTDRFTSEARKAAVEVAKANVEAQKAAVGRLEELVRFKQIVAPFDGIVTQRNVDIGDLVTAEGKSGHPLFQVADVHMMRTYVDVPQAFLESMKPGLEATLSVTGKGKTFPAKVASTANAVSESSRTGLVELHSDNPDGQLWPGSFTEVHFHIQASGDTLRIPVTALIFVRHGIQVARLVDGDRVELVPVDIGRNLGVDVEVRKGIALGDKLVDNPQESIRNGDLVHVEGDKAAAVKTSSSAP